MVVTVSSSDPRSVKALAILKMAHTWTRGHLKDGRPFFAIPGSQGHVYWTDTRDCTCPDRQDPKRRQTVPACKHMLAVRMWTLQQSKATPARRQPACYACGAALPAGLIVGLCNPCTDAGAFATVLGSKAARPIVQTI